MTLHNLAQSMRRRSNPSRAIANKLSLNGAEARAMENTVHFQPEADRIGGITGVAAASVSQTTLRTVARLRALSVMLCLDVERADELVEVTLKRASATIDPLNYDVNLTFWLYRRLRGIYYREPAFRVLPGERINPPRFRTLEQGESFAALAALSSEEREALVLIEAGGFSLNDAASICGCTLDHIHRLLRRASARLSRNLLAKRPVAPSSTVTVEPHVSARMI